jgi:hypothetical protein
MKLVKLSLSKKKEVYINPDNVTTIRPYGKNKTLIHFTGGTSTIGVFHSVKDVIAKLTNELNY